MLLRYSPINIGFAPYALSKNKLERLYLVSNFTYQLYVLYFGSTFGVPSGLFGLSNDSTELVYPWLFCSPSCSLLNDVEDSAIVAAANAVTRTFCFVLISFGLFMFISNPFLFADIVSLRAIYRERVLTVKLWRVGVLISCFIIDISGL